MQWLSKNDRGSKRIISTPFALLEQRREYTKHQIHKIKIASVAELNNNKPCPIQITIFIGGINTIKHGVVYGGWCYCFTARSGDIWRRNFPAHHCLHDRYAAQAPLPPLVKSSTGTVFFFISPWAVLQHAALVWISAGYPMEPGAREEWATNQHLFSVNRTTSARMCSNLWFGNW